LKLEEKLFLVNAPAAPVTTTELLPLEVAGQRLRIEWAWVGSAPAEAPLLVFLHEGLGSLAMWRDFPQRLCDAMGYRGLVYSRPGYGRSTPRPATERWRTDFMHIQAEQVLPALLAALGVDGSQNGYHLFGHSDGGSISLIHAARFPERVASCTVLAPHILVEEFGLTSIREARQAYLHTDLRTKLAKYHDDVDSAFWGWNDVWLSPAFERWNLFNVLPQLRAPVLAIQGQDDVYGTMAQIDGIAAAHPATQLLKLPDCGHSPHKDQAAAVLQAVKNFLPRLQGPATAAPV
jgi:pimeloyl-ACP methyl ester carboxylesterase